ncbi:hypothetical protein A9Q84_05930 [Halobacteriovorax marinus]|uniref:Outer membrane protein beta-barrel domain-containing protein n=1 Tax=Halobacteriovorax marinus TaxID=97084 RepID=A0A1Y5FB74_9BACT|nr:hypothetical protein A9Q84_05930 [Halobacteriovorax marinus]
MTKKIELLLFLFSVNCIAADFSQTVPGQATGDPLGKVEAGANPHVPGQFEKFLDAMDIDGDSPHVQSNKGYSEKVSGKGSPIQFNSGVPYSGLKSDSYISHSNEAILERINNKAESTLSFEYYQNNFEYKDSKGVYEKTFNSNSGAKGGSLHLSKDFYFSKGGVNLAWGLGSGIGYSTGKGIFAANGTTSNMRFNLYSIPVDIRLLLEVPIARVMKISFAAGPSMMGLIQSRSDRDAEDKDKTKYQVGYGYFGEGKLKFNLGYLFTGTGFEYYKSYEVSFMSIDLSVRTQSYSGFADDITISGMSYGLGFTFEFL